MSDSLDRDLLALGSSWRASAPHDLRLSVSTLVQAAANRVEVAEASPARSPRWRSPLVAGAACVALVVLLVAIPGARVTIARQVDKVLQALRIAPHTELITPDAQTKQEVDASLRQFEHQLNADPVNDARTKPSVDASPGRTVPPPSRGRMWNVSTVYGGFGGAVKEEAYFDPQRIDDPAILIARAPIALMAFDGEYRGEAVTFNHALLAPDGVVLAFFGAHATELLLVQAPVGQGRSVAFSRVVTGAGGSVIGVAPAIETLTLSGQAVTWDPDTTGIMPNNSALRWEANGVSYSLYGRALTRDEAVAVFSSLRPLR